MKKHTIILCIIMCIALLLTGCEKASDNRIVGSVQGENIYFWELCFFLDTVKTEMLNQAGLQTDAEFENFWKTTLIDGMPSTEIAKNKAMEQAILFKSKVVLAKQSGLSVTDDMKREISKQIADTKTAIGGENAFQETLDNIGITEGNYKQLMEESFLVNHYYASLVENKTIDISPDMAQEYYNNNRISFRNKVLAKHILFSVVDENQNPKPEDEQQAAQTLANDVYNQILNGEIDFDTAMNTYSEDPGLSANPNGYLFGRGEMVQEFEDTAFSLAVGEMSAPIKTSFGWHIILVTNEEPATYEEAQQTIHQILSSEAIENYCKTQSANFSITRDESLIDKVSF